MVLSNRRPRWWCFALVGGFILPSFSVHWGSTPVPFFPLILFVFVTVGMLLIFLIKLANDLQVAPNTISLVRVMLPLLWIWTFHLVIMAEFGLCHGDQVVAAIYYSSDVICLLGQIRHLAHASRTVLAALPNRGLVGLVTIWSTTANYGAQKGR